MIHTDAEIDRDLFVFESNPDFSDNSRGLYEYLKANTVYKLFWVIKDERMLAVLRRRGISCAIEGSEEANDAIASARYLVTSSFMFAFNKKPGQVHISLWHGFGPKLIGFFEDAAAEDASMDNLKIITTQTDMVATISRASQLMMSGMLALDPRKVKVTGFPRNDLIGSIDARRALGNILGADLSQAKLFFYLPTMRNGIKPEGEQFEDNLFNYSDFDRENLDTFLTSENAYIVAKLHFADSRLNGRAKDTLPSRVKLLDDYSLGAHLLTIYHLLSAFDALITDYSSVYVDYLLLDRPIVFSCPDFAEYSADRGFIMDDPRLMMPGVFVSSQQELTCSLRDILNDIDESASERARWMSFFHHFGDRNSASRVLNNLIDWDDCHCDDSSKTIIPELFNENSPLRQYLTKSATADFYFDRGSGYCEKDKISLVYEVSFDASRVQLDIDVPAGVKAVRFDPDRSGNFALCGFKVEATGADCAVGESNGIRFGRNYLFVDDDPQIAVLMSSSDGGILHLSFERLEGGANRAAICSLFESGIEMEKARSVNTGHLAFKEKLRHFLRV